jgi:hypothetical protein
MGLVTGIWWHMTWSRPFVTRSVPSTDSEDFTRFASFSFQNTEAVYHCKITSLSLPCLNIFTLSQYLYPVSISLPCLNIFTLSQYLYPVSISLPCLSIFVSSQHCISVSLLSKQTICEVIWTEITVTAHQGQSKKFVNSMGRRAEVYQHFVSQPCEVCHCDNLLLHILYL